MNLFQLVLKQMRQRALGTWLTLLSVMLGVALASGVFILRRGADKLFGQNEFGYDVIVGSKLSPLQLVLNTVYHIDRSPGNIPYAVYEQVSGQPYRAMVKIAVPIAVGDSYKNHRIVGTLPKLFGFDDDGTPLAADKVMEYRPGHKYEIAQGKVFAAEKFEAIIGSDITQRTGLKIGDTFQSTHGLPQPGETPDVHESTWTVVGVLKPTHTANDRVIFIPLTSFYTIAEHETGLVAQQAIREGKDPNKAIAEREKQKAEAEHDHDHAKPATKDEDEHDHDHAHDDHDHEEGHGDAHAEEDHDHDHDHSRNYTVRADGTIDLHLPKDIRGLSAILVKSRSNKASMDVQYVMNNSNVPAMAVSPAQVMREFFSTFLRGSNLLLLVISLLVSVVAGVSILVSIYNSVSARMKEIAILRALGATRRRVLAMICLEAGFIGLMGGVLGLIVGHLTGAVASVYFDRYLGESIDWITPDAQEWYYLAVVVLISLLAGLVPAMKAYRTPVATNLTSS